MRTDRLPAFNPFAQGRVGRRRQCFMSCSMALRVGADYLGKAHIWAD